MSDKVFIVDDEETIRDGLKWLFESCGYVAETFPSGEAFLAAYRPEWSGCLVLDVRMPGMSGLELFERLKERHCTLPVIFLTGHGDIAMAVEAIHKGAADFIEKPASDNQLVEKVAHSLAREAQRRQRSASAETVHTRLSSLTSREIEVMRLILVGRLNKNIADELNISMRTVEVHRARVLEKMGVNSAVELAQTLAAFESRDVRP
ncbi:MAG: response regulator transcription factor [Sulfuricella sp.]|nr:response regulator transcription factor [Sulfuricella sp.]